MGDPSVPLLLLGLHAPQIPLDTDPRQCPAHPITLAHPLTLPHLPHTCICICFYISYFGLGCIQGILISVGGLGMLVGSDFLTDKNYPALSRGKGDAFMIIGATLYGFSASPPPPSH